MFLMIIAGLIGSLMGWLAREIMKWFAGVYDGMFYNVMCVEVNFKDIINAGNFNLTGLYQAIYTFAIALLMMFFVKKMLETYMAWSNRRSRNITFDNFNRFPKSINYYDMLWFYL